MTKAAELAKMGEVLTNSQIGGRRNIVINGAMQVAQRGTSFTGVGSSAYHLDRMRTGIGDTSARFTVTQATAGLNGFANSLKYDCTTAQASLGTDSRLFIEYKVEGQDLQQLKKGTSDAEKVTISFYVKSNKTGTYICEMFDYDNSRQISKAYTISSSGTWEQKTITFDADTTGAYNNDNAHSLSIYWHLLEGSRYSGGTLSTTWTSSTEANRAAGQVNLADSTDNTWEITGIQMEVGEQATPFEHRSFGEELQLCLRYYEKSYDYSVVPGTSNGFDGAVLASVVSDGTTSRIAPNNSFMMRKRTEPTLSVFATHSGTSNEISNYSSGADKTISSISTLSETKFRYFNMTDAGATNEQYEFQYVADAEL
jgi:hypothetical protein